MLRNSSKFYSKHRQSSEEFYSVNDSIISGNMSPTKLVDLKDISSFEGDGVD